MVPAFKHSVTANTGTAGETTTEMEEERKYRMNESVELLKFKFQRFGPDIV